MMDCLYCMERGPNEPEEVKAELRRRIRWDGPAPLDNALAALRDLDSRPVDFMSKEERARVAMAALLEPARARLFAHMAWEFDPAEGAEHFRQAYLFLELAAAQAAAQLALGNASPVVALPVRVPVELEDCDGAYTPDFFAFWARDALDLPEVWMDTAGVLHAKGDMWQEEAEPLPGLEPAPEPPEDGPSSNGEAAVAESAGGDAVDAAARNGRKRPAPAKVDA